MKKGSQADFWRSADIGRALAAQGWSARGLSLDRDHSVSLNGKKCRALEYVQASGWGCHTGAIVWPPSMRPPDRDAGKKVLVEFSGRGQISVAPDGKQLILSRGITRARDIEAPGSRGRRASRTNLSSIKRARLIGELLQWLKRRQKQGWRAYTIYFQREWNFSSEGHRWLLYSALFFARREGLHWNSGLHLVKPTRETPSAKRDAKRVLLGMLEDIRKQEFRVSNVYPTRRDSTFGAIFDQDFLPTGELLRKARWLARWAGS